MRMGNVCWRISAFFFQAEDGIRDLIVTGVKTCALPIWTEDGYDRVDARLERGSDRGLRLVPGARVPDVDPDAWRVRQAGGLEPFRHAAEERAVTVDRADDQDVRRLLRSRSRARPEQQRPREHRDQRRAPLRHWRPPRPHGA